MSNETHFSVDKENFTTTLMREFDAPVELLFKAHSDASMIPQWWGRDNTSTVVDKLEFKEGGKWRYVEKADDGEFAFRGEFKEIVMNEKIVWTFEFEGMAGHILTETMQFEDLGNGRSKLMTVSQFNNLEDLEGMLSYGMEQGARQTWNRLEKLMKHLTI